jgi:protein-S-isoprenylcysteine O-methyltransferase Ste14
MYAVMTRESLGMKSLARKSFIGLIELQVAMILLLFVPAGSLRFWEGWVYWILFSLAVIAITLYFLKHDPRLIEGRLTAGPRAEQETSQKIIQAIAAMLFFAVLIVPALDYRFHWSRVPTAIVVIGDFLLMLSFAMIFFVFRENSYAAATIKVEAEQRVISTGPYRLVRHPMYSAALILFLATPLALASAWGLIVVIPLAATLVARLMDEERYLSAHLPGYDRYRQRVNYRLIPLVW